ncbi:hypothetical protein [Pseudonocardia sp. H11422]|uniref:hypothetical protein n=1 Tax=Pseudonocardia sp. H11422 TaxID=2835866 RepID=UPI001BDCCAC4|nr:hypothetical protein [Pseudonocardia sp. H11422]
MSGRDEGAPVAAPGPASVPMEQWGRRLSDAVRAALDAGDVAAALRLVREGDGQTRSLAKEYSLMYRGLGITVRVILDELRMSEDSAAGSGAAAGAAVAVHRFRSDFVRIMGQVWGDAPPPPGPVGSPADEARECVALLEFGEQRFDTEQRRLAEQVAAALEGGEVERARELLDRKEAGQFVPLHDRLIRVMAESFAHVLAERGPDGLLQFHLDVAQGQRAGIDKWEALPARDLAHAFTFLLKQHMGTVEAREEPDRFVLEQALCGSGGRLVAGGSYAGPDALPQVRDGGVLTAGRDTLPVYCTHCPGWNTLAPQTWYGHPHVVLADPARPDGACTLHILKRSGST